jgi:hypothetical protein
MSKSEKSTSIINLLAAIATFLAAAIPLLLVLKSCGGDPPPPPPPITGKVISKWDNKPVEKAEVLVTPLSGDNKEPIGPFSTDSYGRFSIPIKNGKVKYRIDVTAKYHKPYDVSSFEPQETRDVQLVPESMVPGEPTPPIIGVDPETQKKATFQFHLITTDHAWKYGSTDKLEDLAVKDKFVDAKIFLDKKIAESNTQEKIKQSKELIAVGVASCEGNRNEEESRADKRARFIRQTLTPVTSQDIHLLILGQYKYCKPQDDTIKQRQLIVIYVIEEDEGVGLKQALASATKQLKAHLDKPSESPLGVMSSGDYSLYELRLN